MFKRIIAMGDLHGNINKLASIVRLNGIGEGDLVLVAGDFGFVMRNSYGEETILDDITNGGFTLAFVAGNHEHFPRLSEYPDAEWCGGKVKRIRQNIFKLQNGEMYKIPLLSDGGVTYKTLFAMGGARSTDLGFNENRYPTLWLRCDTDTGKVTSFRSDDPDYDRLKSDCVTLTDRETCYEFTDRVFNAFSSECVESIDVDKSKDRQTRQIKEWLDSLCGSEDRTARQRLCDIIKDTLVSMGYTGSVRVVLMEGTWFKEEIPSGADYKNAGVNLNRAGMKTDIILTHTLPSSVIQTLSRKLGFYVDTGDRQSMELTGFLDYILHDVSFSQWIAGHFHCDNSVSDFLSDIYPDIKQSDSKYNNIHILYEKIKVIE